MAVPFYRYSLETAKTEERVDRYNRSIEENQRCRDYVQDMETGFYANAYKDNCVDSDGREVPTAAPDFVSFHTNGLGAVIATGSDISDHVPPYYTNRRMRAGRITVAVRVGKTAGTLRVYANSDNLETGVLTIDLK